MDVVSFKLPPGLFFYIDLTEPQLYYTHQDFSFSSSTPCVTSPWSSCLTPEPVDPSSTFLVMTSSLSRLFNTRRPSSSRSCCLDTSWWALSNGSGNVFSYHRCTSDHREWRKISFNLCFLLLFQNINQNKRTLLPKFYGLYCIQAGGKNIRLVVMNNLLPRVIPMHHKYDLKGSTYKRRASPKEREKAVPTYKDLDFIQDLPDGLLLEADNYNALCKTIQRDCLVSHPDTWVVFIFVISGLSAHEASQDALLWFVAICVWIKSQSSGGETTELIIAVVRVKCFQTQIITWNQTFIWYCYDCCDSVSQAITVSQCG